MQMVLICVLAFLVSLMIGLLLTPILAKVAGKCGVVRKPEPLHKRETHIPTLGGVAIYLSFIITTLCFAFFSSAIAGNLIGILIGATLVFLVGLFDDIKELSPVLKFVGEIIAAVVLIGFGVRTQMVLFPVFLNFLITLFWILFITNAFNFLDIVDGLSGGVALIATLSFLGITFFTNNLTIGIIAAALAGSVLAFLKYNFHPAKVFMGDSGSLFLGFSIAAIAIAISYAPLGREIALLTPFLILGVPIYDTTFLLWMRLIKGKSLMRKSRDHFALRLLMVGYGEKKSIGFIYLVSFLLGISGLVISRVSNRLGITLLTIVALGGIVLARKMGRVDVDEQ